MDPFSIGLGIANAGLGVIGKVAEYQGQKQD